MKHPDFVTVQAAPFNGAPAPALLAAAVQTPAEAFFVRNHGDVPQLAGDDHMIRVSGLVARPLTISVRELRALPSRSVEAVIACAGNRRSELTAIAPVPGELPWQHTALGNAEWGGVPLAALLALAQPLPEAQHVCFEGADVATAGGGTGHRFGASVPLAHAGDALLAMTMNGDPLPPAHGAPLRVVVPGYIGARSVKWLTDITLSATPSDNHYQHGTYRKYPRTLTSAPTDVTQGEMLGPLSVNSAFLAPLDGAQLPAGLCTLRGWAHAGYGARLQRVEVSVDGGATWGNAHCTRGADDSAWSLFEADVTMTPGTHHLRCRATDTDGTQPASMDEQWNCKGYMASAVQRITVTLG